jgi:hypothetical protein
MKRCLQKKMVKVSKCKKQWIRHYGPQFAISKFREEKKYSIKLGNMGCGNVNCSGSGNGIKLRYLILGYLALYLNILPVLDL